MELTIDQALQKGMEAHKAGQVQDADHLYTAILKAQPKHPEANHNMGVLAVGVGKVQEALPFFKTALEANPKKEQFWLSYIDALVKLDKLPDAKAMFNQAKGKGAKGDGFDKLEQRLKASSDLQTGSAADINEAGQAYQNTLNTAIHLRESGKFDEAIDLLEDFITKFIAEADMLALLSNCYISKDDLYTARIHLDKAKHIDPNAASVGWCETRIFLKEKRMTEAVVVAKRTNKRFPDDVEGMGVLGSCLRANNDIEESLSFLNKAIGLKPNYSEALINRGLIRLSQKDRKGALADLEKAHSLKLHITQIWDLVISLKMEFNQFEESIILLKAMTKIDTTNETRFANMAVCYQSLLQHEAAVETYKHLISIKPNFAEAYLDMGNSLKEQRKLDEAIEAYNEALALKPDFAIALNNRGVSLKLQGRLEEAIEDYNNAIATKPNFADAYNNLGSALHEQSKLKEAIGAYNKALAVNPNNAGYYNNLGNTLREQGKLDESIKAFNKALYIQPNLAEAFNNMGASLQEQGKLEEATGAYNKALAINPNYADCFMNLDGLEIQLIGLEPAQLDYKTHLTGSLHDILSKKPKYQILQAILNFMQGRIDLSRQCLEKTASLTKTQISQSLTQEDQVFCHAYSSFLSSLIKNYKVSTSVNLPKVYHLGESHCLSYAHSEILIAGIMHIVSPKITFGAKAYHFSNNKKNKFKSITIYNLENIPKCSNVFVSVGEIDCRAEEGFIRASNKKGKNLNEIINITVCSYIDWFLTQNIVNQHTYYFLNVPAPMYDSNYSKEINDKVARVVGLFNDSLLKKIVMSDTRMIDVYSHTHDKTNFSNGLYHVDKRHLDNTIIPLIQDQLNI